MKEKQTKRKFEKYSIFALLCGIGLVAAGIFGIVSSRIESSEYKNSTDIRKVAAVIETLETHDEKDDNDVIVETKYKTRVSFEIDGKKYTGRYEFNAYARDYAKKNAYDRLRRGDTIDVEVYKTKNGDYKISPDGTPVDFLLYCLAILFGAVIIVGMLYEIFGRKTKKGKSEPTEKEEKN